MADFEELKLTVSLADGASAGIAKIRNELAGLVADLHKTATEASNSLGNVAQGTQQVGKAAARATPQIREQERALKDLSRSAETTGRGISQMLLAMRGGAGSFPQLALGLRQAQQGLAGVNEGMTLLAPSSARLVVGLGAVAIGVAAVTAAVGIYGISVFKFSQEMFTLSQTARSLGMTFGQLKQMTSQNERFGISVENTVGNISHLQEVLSDLYISGSRTREKLLAGGVPPEWLDKYISLSGDLIAQQKFAIEGANDIERSLQAEGKAPIVVEGRVGNFLSDIGQPRNLREIGPTEPETAEQVARNKRIEEQVVLIGEEWRDVLDSVRHIKESFFEMGLPDALKTVKLIGKAFEILAKLIPKLNIMKHGWWDYTKTVFKAHALGPALLIPKVRQWAFPDVFPSPSDAANPAPAAPAAPAAPDISRGRQPWNRGRPNGLFKQSSFGGANDNGFGDGGSEALQAIIKGGVFEALVEYATYLQTGGGGRGGIQNAAYSLGAGGGGFGGMFSGGNAAGRAGIPGGGYGGGGGGPAMPGGVTPGVPGGGHVPRTAGTPGGGGGPNVGVPNIEGMTDDERNKLGLILKYESNGQNKLNYMGLRQGLDPTTPKGYTAQGYYQMLNTNWNRLAPGLGITTKNAMASSLEDQTKVALALMRERPGTGIGHWANFNPRLKAALERGERAGKWAEQVPTPSEAAAPPAGAKTASIDPSQIIGGANVAGVNGDVDPTGKDRLAGNMGLMRGVDPKLVELATAGAKYLPKGYTLRPVSGVREGSQGYHSKLAATDWQIYRPDGTPIPHKGDDHSGLYTLWARGAYTEAMKQDPRMAAKLGWGGAFETSPGSRNPDIMHLDWGGQRGRLRPGNILSNLGPLSKEEQAAALAKANPDRPALDRTIVDKQNGGSGVSASGGVDVNVKAPAGTKVEYNGSNLLEGKKTTRETDLVTEENAL